MRNVLNKEFKKELVFGQNLLVILFLYFGIAAIFDYFLAINILGLSLFVTVITYLVVFFVFIKNVKIIDENQINLYQIIVILLLGIVVARTFLYGENFISLMGANRFIIFVPLVLMLCNKINFEKESDKMIRYSLLGILLIHTLNSVFYFFGLPSIEHVDILADDYVEFSRFGGIMGGANVQAVFTSTIYMILILSNLRMSVAKSLVLTLVAIIAVVPTLSRGGMLVIVLTLMYFFYIKFKKGTFFDVIGILFGVLAVIAIASTQIDFSNLEVVYTSFFNRFDQDDLSSGRGDRLVYFWQIINEGFVPYLIGVPTSVQETATNSISDNVFTLLPVDLGLLFTIIFLLFILTLNSKDNTKRQGNIYCFLVIIFIISFTNNSIIWTAWTYYAIFGFFYLKFKNRQAELKYCPVEQLESNVT
jgi:hypothetical protein